MLLSPVNVNTVQNTQNSVLAPSFEHAKNKNNYSTKQKALVATTSAVGVLGAMMLLARHQNMKFFTKKFKDSYFVKANYANPVPIIGMGAGSILGGLAGGYLIDKNKTNRKAKSREALLQMGNVAIPILTVDLAVDKLFKNASKWGKAIAGIGGVFVGVALANIIMNKVNNLIFQNKDERGVKITDYSAHVDDIVTAASYISKSKVVYYISRIIPFALMIPGNEVGKKTVG
ncbi:MAG: hypothetical protein MJ231_01425 [bacterium]|nr:hypothetical protein [bacterium]